jgi:hypothetical protein
VAAAHPDRVDIRVLSQFPEFIEFTSRSRSSRQVVEPDLDGKVEATPREAVYAAVDEANARHGTTDQKAFGGHPRQSDSVPVACPIGR